MRELTLRTALGLIGMIWVGTVSAADLPPDQVEFFEKSVRPVLVESCVKCHGAKKQASGLRVDSREAIVEGGVNGPSVVLGQPDASLLIQAVRQTHEDIKMPPKGKLSDPVVEALATWVKMGAPWPADAPKTAATNKNGDPASTHWSFRPVKSVPLPSVKDAGWVRTPVDAFILDGLEKKGLKPSAGAEKRILIRRATFDLTGLPPTVAEIEAFLKDEAPDAYDRLVDRLLNSPRYGEHWARHWLDVARYADTKGYVFTQERRYPYSYTFRDYVINAFNDDKPYDQFVTEQIAADRLGPNHDPRALAALGFLTVGRRFLNVQEDMIDDRIDVVTRGLLGLTVACARCHDHKFDPIPTDDYYSLYGVFNSSVEPAEPPEIPSTVADDAMSADFNNQLKAKQKAVDAFLDARRNEIQGDLRGHVAEYLRAAFDLGFDPKNPKLDDRAKADKLTPGRLRAMNGRWKAKLEASRTAHDPIFVPWHAFAALPPAEFGAKAANVAKSLPLNDPKAANPIVAKSFADAPPATMADVVARYGSLFADVEKQWKEAEKAGKKAVEDPHRESLRQVLYAGNGPVTVTTESLARLILREDRPKLEELRKEVTNLRASHPGSPPRAMVLNDLPTPIEPRVFLRGNIGRQGKQVPRQFLSVLSGPDRKPFKDGSGRLDLARAIASKDNPLTARVMVNRVWLNHFGAGLVSSPSDFGTRSDPPSHPELLDWLADDFMRQGWSIKSLHRRIMLSNTYRQRSDPRPDLLAADPENRLYGRFNRRRLGFESMRDSLLAASGTLDPTMGGRSVMITEAPYPPRRTIYGFIDRQNLDGVYRTFDFASPDASSPKRINTTVPQQALFFMNSPFVVEQAKRLASLPEMTTGSPDERVRRVYSRLFGRAPDANELALGVAFVQAQEQAGPSLPAPVWSYGFGKVDTASGRIAGFTPLPHWSGNSWQFGPTMPASEVGYLNWSPSGGHSSRDLERSGVLRWTAPKDATIALDASLNHPASQGDGVRARVVSSREGVVGEVIVHHANVPLVVPRLVVKRGDTLDLVVDCRNDDSFDSFNWTLAVRELEGANDLWDAKSGFHGPVAGGLSPWEEYAQVLLLTNEFVFVD